MYMFSGPTVTQAKNGGAIPILSLCIHGIMHI
jgi:hypothetical protein